MTRTAGSLLPSVSPARGAALVVFGGLGLWAYWPTLGAMGHKWLHDPQYSHGYLVPVFAAVLLWCRRSRMPGAPPALCWWGVPLVAAGVLMRLAGVYVSFDWLDAASLLPCLAGLVVLLGGWPALRWAWPALAFLLFMIPLPFRVENTLSHPLQRIATEWSTYLMQTAGLPALSEGNTILLSHSRIGIVEACNGLSMMLVFFAFATGLAIVINRPWLDKAILVLSAAPVAVLTNVVRIAVTGTAQELGNPQLAQAVFHDWAGWLMMPVALGLLWGEVWLLSRVLVRRAPTAAPAGPIPGPNAAPAPRKSRKSRRQSVPPLPQSNRSSVSPS